VAESFVISEVKFMTKILIDVNRKLVSFNGRLCHSRSVINSDDFSIYMFGETQHIDEVGMLYKYENSDWSSIDLQCTYDSGGTTYQGYISCCIFDSTSSNLYIGGAFDNIGGISANGIVRYNIATNTWHALGGGLTYSGDGVGEATSIVFDGAGNLYVVGYFTSAGGQPAQGFVKYSNTGVWSSILDCLYQGATGSPYLIAYDSVNNALYLGGTFDQLGSVTGLSSIAKYDISTNTASNLTDGGVLYENSDAWIEQIEFHAETSTLFLVGHYIDTLGIDGIGGGTSIDSGGLIIYNVNASPGSAWEVVPDILLQPKEVVI